ncbi:hypothetical protein DVH24_027343 [Malus domestica]|uniref:DNA mismatch repair proteins mutS family domain-containing protein n=1 Tax=Malus domestica TaxID=3750 RepID=A0A498IQE8_MALDO|nr:hypothetical protein DVH24_027343 [Malus domestica]
MGWILFYLVMPQQGLACVKLRSCTSSGRVSSSGCGAEPPEQMDLRRKEDGSRDKVMKREICAVVTKGTLTEGEMVSANPDASYLMAMTENSQNLANQTAERPFGVCVVDVAPSQVILGQFGDDLECSALSCLLSELRPVEIVKPAKLLSPETEKVQIRHTRSPLVNELVPLSEFWDVERTVLSKPCKGLPDVNSVLKHFKDAFDWVEANNSGHIIPHEGVDIEYDSACEKITYVTVGKDSYLLEMPESLCSNIPSDYELHLPKKLGADVPAESFELSPVDRIFVCMGAKDNIMVYISDRAIRNCNNAVHWVLGSEILSNYRRRESVLEHFIYKAQCRGMFSTHYHRLAVDYQNNSKVSLCHMACQVGNGDGGVEEVTFLYRMSPGACPKSYGVNIARLGGKDLCLTLLPY